MNPSGRISRSRLKAGILVPLLVFLASSCGSGGSNFAGGGTGGTGISTGSVTAFGSVVVNGVHFKTDDDVAPGFRTKKVVDGMEDRSGRPDKEVFAAGMVVTVRHGAADNNASEIGYRNNLLGPVAEKLPGPDNVIVVLGHGVVVDNAAVFASIRPGDVVEVSGFADDAGRIRATYIGGISPSVRPYGVKGFISGLSGNTFRLGPLPGGQGATVAVSFGASAVSALPGGPVEGMYALVTTSDRAPSGGAIAADGITKLAARTDFPNGTTVVLEGLVTRAWSGAGDDRSFALEGKTVRWDADAKFIGGTDGGLLQGNSKVQVQGTEAGGVLSAARIVFPQ
jgi:hypothetical protein